MIKGVWLDEMRGKTGNDRRARLWLIPRKALCDIRKNRNRSKVMPVEGYQKPTASDIQSEKISVGR